MSQVLSKKNAALRALNWIQPDQVVGIGTGSTVNALIELLPSIRSKLHVTVS
ncbi:MAG: ribose 5-phosphate isomerase A, partial [Gammaproteobacteria bacterium]|nr:ribose 5-phosphate isomerase A [Gammaproteobacteria bacterium]